MLVFGLLMASLFFAVLALDAYQFEASSRFRAFAVPMERMGRAVGVDPLSTLQQDQAQTNRFTAVGGIPGLFWVFVALAAGFFAAAAWSFF
ncbi:hypothetical protein ACSFA8_26775 [Variovorax sp. RT4R15]|uniref:hypothetical protein n=1 Tax=Variovorax sp. RT4R15 TaxID=3443737 RepID=UPI003F47D3AD